MSEIDICYMSASELAKRYRDRSLSPVEVVKALISRAEKINPKLNAFTYTFYEEALNRAKISEQKFSRESKNVKALEGIPIGIKDESALKGKPMSNGSLILKDTISDYNSPVNERILKTGAIVIARTATPEFSCAGYCHNRVTGITRNPWNLDFTPGGSSGGSGAALAAGMVPLATGSDIGGSIRIPASASGVVGFKPPYGRNPDDTPLNLDFFCHVGPMARSVRDTALLQNVMVGPHPLDIASIRPKKMVPLKERISLKGLKIGWSADLGMFEVDPEVMSNFNNTLQILKSMGAHLEEVSLPWKSQMLDACLDYLYHIFGVWIEETAKGKEHMVTPYVKQIAALGKKSSAKKYLRSLEVVNDMNASFGPMISKKHAFLCPTLAIPAVKANHDQSKDTVFINGKEVNPLLGWCLTVPFNALSRLPVMSVPSGFSKTGVPTGVQIVGKSFADQDVFNVAYFLESSQKWYQAGAKPDI